MFVLHCWCNHLALCILYASREVKVTRTETYRARFIQPKFQPVRPGKEDHLKMWTRFSKLFRLDRTDPLRFGPKFPESLVEWIAPIYLAVCAYQCCSLDNKQQTIQKNTNLQVLQLRQTGKYPRWKLINFVVVQFSARTRLIILTAFLMTTTISEKKPSSLSTLVLVVVASCLSTDLCMQW